MILNKKTILILALAISFVAGHPGYMRNLKKKEGAPNKGLSLKRVKGRDNDPDEVDVDVKLKTCKKGSDECKELEDNENSRKVTKEEFSKKIADDMIAALEKEDDEDKDDNEHGRKLDYYCDIYWWCDCCYCYEYYDCYYW
jgi:hypothetical protein